MTGLTWIKLHPFRTALTLISAALVVTATWLTLPEIFRTSDTAATELTTENSAPDEVMQWLSLQEGSAERSAVLSLEFSRNDAGKLRVSGRETFRLLTGDPIADALIHGVAADDGASFERALGCSLYTEESGWIYPRAPRITAAKGSGTVTATLPFGTSTLDVRDSVTVSIQCSYNNDEEFAPPVGKRSFVFSSRGYSFTGISGLNSEVQRPHKVTAETERVGIYFDVFLDTDDAHGGVIAGTSGDSRLNNLVLALCAVVLGLLVCRAWLSGFSRAFRLGACTVMVTSAVAGYIIGVSEFSGSGYETTRQAFLANVSFAWWGLLLPALLMAAFWRHSTTGGQAPLPRRLRTAAAVPFAAQFIACATVAALFGNPGTNGLTLAWTSTGAVIGMALLCRALGHRYLTGAGLGLLLLTGLWTASLLTVLPGIYTFFLGTGCSLCWAAAITLHAHRIGAWHSVALTGVGATAALCLSPLQRDLSWSGENAVFRVGTDAGAVTYGLMELAALAVAVTALGFAVRRGDRADAVQDEAVRVAGVVVVALSISPLQAGYEFMTSDVIACALGAIGFWLLLPRSKADLAFRLSRLTPGAHARLMRTEARRRVYRQAWSKYHKSADSALSGGDTTRETFEEKWNALADRAMSRTGSHTAKGSPALSGSAARTPRQNALSAGLLGLLFASPLVVLDLGGWQDAVTSLSLVQLLILSLHVLHWVAYAAFYGYFYPRLPGHSPVAKSAFFAFALLLPELTLLPLSPPYTTQDAVTALLLRTGEAVVFAFGLGLSWEAHITRLAGMPWSSLRDLRKLSTLTAPTLTVVVAAATTVATALAGTAAVAMLQSGPSTPAAPSGPASSSPAPHPSGTP